MINWVHPQTGERVLQTDPHIFNGAMFNLNSYVGHTFEVKELPQRSGKCVNGKNPLTCGVSTFTVNDKVDQGTCGFFLG